jgi:hypothetical protein
MSCFISGMAPCFAYLSTRSGLMPSAAKNSTGVPLGRPSPLAFADRFPAAPAVTDPATSSAKLSVRAAKRTGRNRNVRLIRLLSPG